MYMHAHGYAIDKYVSIHIYVVSLGSEPRLDLVLEGIAAREVQDHCSGILLSHKDTEFQCSIALLTHWAETLKITVWARSY